MGAKCGFGDAIYCCEPLQELVGEYNTFIEKTEADNEGVTRMLDAKDLDIAKLKKENEKFLSINGEKESWKKYEEMLGKERLMNKILFEKLTAI